MKTTTFSITGMHCTSCALNIDCFLEELSGVIKVETSYIKEETAIEYDERALAEEEIVNVINNLGYKARKL